VQKKLAIDYYLMIAMGLFFCVLLVFISYFVGPFSDESFPIATSLRFIKGQSPFIDDLSPFIPLGLLLYPLIKLSLWLHHGNNELILFLRHCYIVFAFLTSGYSFFLIRNKLPLILSFFIIFGIILFHPFGINNFHYDTLATLLWSNILFQFFCFQYIETLRKTHLIIFSLFNLILCFAYPTFLFLLIPFYLIFYSFSHHSKRILFVHFLISFLASLGMIWVIFYHFNISMQDIQNFLNFLHRISVASYQGIFYKFVELLHRLTSKYSFDLLIASAALLIAYYGRKYWFILLPCFFFILGFPFLKINIQLANYNDAFFVLNYMGLLSFPLFLIFLRKDPDAKKLLVFIGLPSLAAGLLTSLTAHLLDLNFIIGFFPAAILAYIFIFFIFQKYIIIGFSLRYFATRAVLIFGLMELAFFQWNFIYGSPFAGIATYKNSVKIEMQNPFGGLYVDSTCHSIVIDLQKDMHILDTPLAKEFVYFGSFSAGYLFPNQLRPGEYVLYSSPNQNHFGEKIRTPNYIFDFSKFWQIPNEIGNYLKGTDYKKIATRQFYDIYASEDARVLEINEKS
jgi:hypothetical protein